MTTLQDLGDQPKDGDTDGIAVLDGSDEENDEDDSEHNDSKYKSFDSGRKSSGMLFFSLFFLGVFLICYYFRQSNFR